MKNSIVISLLLLSALSSCSEGESVASEKTKLLVSKPWKETKRESHLSGGTTTDISSTIADCDKDNTIKFNTNEKYEDRVGSTLCFSFEENTTGDWHWKNNESIITLTNNNGLTTEYALVSISSTTMTLGLDGGQNEEIHYISSAQ